MTELFRYDLVQLGERIREKSASGDYNLSASEYSDTFVYQFDVMGSFKKIRMKSLQTFGHLSETLVDSVMRTVQKATEIHFVLDNDIDGSTKDSKRLHRCKSKPIEL